MQRLPFALSIPHGGVETPKDFRELVVATRADQREDIDHLTREIFGVPEGTVATHISFGIARTFVDLNRHPDAWGPLHPDGVVKSLTHIDRPVFSRFPDQQAVQQVLDQFYRPYHERLAAAVADPRIVLLLDCHSMAPLGLSVSPDRPGQPRPLINLGHRGGRSAPLWVVGTLREIMAQVYEIPVEEIVIDSPFNGGYITDTHCSNSSYAIQIEFNRAFYLGAEEGKVVPALPQDMLEVWRRKFLRTLELLHLHAFSRSGAIA